jgi:hypothetical protein
VAVIGMDDHFEIWAKDVWEAQRMHDMEQFPANYRKIPELMRAWVEPSPLPTAPQASPPPAPPATPAQGRNDGA